MRFLKQTRGAGGINSNVIGIHVSLIHYAQPRGNRNTTYVDTQPAVYKLCNSLEVCPLFGNSCNRFVRIPMAHLIME